MALPINHWQIKNLHTADWVAVGFQYASAGHIVGSLLLGLRDDHGLRHPVGCASALSREEETHCSQSSNRGSTPRRSPAIRPGGPSTERSRDCQPIREN
jgi:ATP-dependent DNA ligase